MKIFLVSILALLISGASFGQKELLAYKITYRIADSLNAIGEINRFDSTIFKVADSLNHCHPIGYFKVAGELLNKSQYNEAAFMYYLGILRYRYYNAVNPNYKPEDDGALFASLKNAMNDPINMYQRINIDNFISVLKKVTKYTAENDYAFYSRSNNIDKYNELTDKYNVMIGDLETNKEKYSAQWNNERIEFEKNIDTMLDEQKQGEAGDKKKSK